METRTALGAPADAVNAASAEQVDTGALVGRLDSVRFAWKPGEEDLIDIDRFFDANNIQFGKSARAVHATRFQKGSVTDQAVNSELLGCRL